MDSGKLNDWMQVIGLFAVVASLVFVGLQMKQAHEIALAETYQARAEMSVNLESEASANPEFTSAMAKVYRGEAEKVTGEERIALEYYLGASITMFENLHFQYLSGFLPEEHWSRNLEDINCMMSLPAYRTIIEEWNFRDSFQSLLDRAIDEARQNPSDSCWIFPPKPIEN